MVVFISGANRGIGLHQAKYFLADGDTVIGTYRDKSASEELFDLAKEHPGRCHTVRGDVRIDADVQNFAVFASTCVAAIDILINNAGIDIEQHNPGLESVPMDLLKEVYDVNTLGSIRVCRALLPLVRKSTAPNRGLIVNTTSGIGTMASPVSMTRYGYMMSKAAVCMFSRVMAYEFARTGPTVIAWSPGWVQTRLGTPAATYPLDEAGRLNVNVLKSITSAHNGKLMDISGQEMPF
jgi:NAD(P)-dependent dehydrogenase (short-subunit alcohol dehydrogenase family)